MWADHASVCRPYWINTRTSPWWYGAAALKMLPLYNTDPQHTLAVKEGDVLTLGRHELQFIAAPMVHWPGS